MHCLRKLQQTKQWQMIFRHTCTCRNLNLLHYTARSEKCHIKPAYWSLDRNLETGHKVMGQCWHWDVFICTCKYHRREKSLILHWDWPLFPLPCTKVSFPKTNTRWRQRPADGTHSLLMAWLKVSLAFYHEMQWPWPARFSLSPNDITAQCLHRFLPLPFATFLRFHHSVVPQHCSLSEQRTLPGVWSSLPGNGNFSP